MSHPQRGLAALWNSPPPFLSESSPHFIFFITGFIYCLSPLITKEASRPQRRTLSVLVIAVFLGLDRCLAHSRSARFVE